MRTPFYNTVYSIRMSLRAGTFIKVSDQNDEFRPDAIEKNRVWDSNQDKSCNCDAVDKSSLIEPNQHFVSSLET